MASLSTSRGFPYPAVSDAPNVHSDIQALATRADGEFLTVANDASLPSFGTVGRRAYSVASGDTFLDIGTAWVNQTRVTPDRLQQDLAEKLGISNNTGTRRGSSRITNEHTRSSATPGVLTVADEVGDLTLTSDGLIAVLFYAEARMTSGTGGTAQIFLNEQPVQVPYQNAPSGRSANGAAVIGSNKGVIHSYGGGLGSTAHNASAVYAQVTTGTVIGGGKSTLDISNANGDYAGGPCYIWAAAGNYVVSIRYTGGSGTIAVSQRRLYAWAEEF